MTLFQQDSAPAPDTPCHARATVELLRQETPNVLAPNLRPPNNPDLSAVHYEIWAVVQHRVYPQTNIIGLSVYQIKSIVWMNWNGGWSMSGAVLNSRLLARLLTSGEEHIERVSVAKGGYFEYSLWTDNVDFVHSCYIQSFNVICFTVTSWIMKSCQ